MPNPRTIASEADVRMEMLNEISKRTVDFVSPTNILPKEVVEAVGLTIGNLSTKQNDLSGLKEAIQDMRSEVEPGLERGNADAGIAAFMQDVLALTTLYASNDTNSSHVESDLSELCRYAQSLFEDVEVRQSISSGRHNVIAASITQTALQNTNIPVSGHIGDSLGRSMLEGVNAVQHICPIRSAKELESNKPYHEMGKKVLEAPQISSGSKTIPVLRTISSR